MIETILLDLDDTVFDFSACEKAALTKALCAMRIEPAPDILKRYAEINASLWRMLEQKKITRPELRIRRFESLFSEFKICKNASEIAEKYENALGRESILMPDALSVLQELSVGFRLYAATNGYVKTQTNRLENSGLRKFFRGVFISQEIGFDKPSPEYFAAVFAEIPDFSREKAVMVGDILVSDIKGGNAAGLKTVWFNRKGEKNETDIVPTAEIKSLRELPEILRRI